ncbi:MAG: polymer-forming cytoskeletal protein [Lachnospiraceae bacterium]|nr:polymer-forming cytoskeletal protein [Lachnospiraceae bacterium]
MGFFSDLKEDLSQAVNELKPEGESLEERTEEITDAELDELGADLDALFDSSESAQIDENKEIDIDFGEMEAETKVEEDITAASEPSFNEEPVSAPAPEPVPVFIPTPAPAPAVNLNRVAQDEVSVIMDSMIINGNMATEGSLEIRGSIVGNVEALGKLNITGSIQGDSSAAEIFAENAKITGDVKSLGAIKVGQSSVIIGNISATSAVIAGAIKGDIDVKGPVILDASAIVMGNIKSKSVQINNGAVIEGMCSQCYAEVNPTSFFEELKKMK